MQTLLNNTYSLQQKIHKYEKQRFMHNSILRLQKTFKFCNAVLLNASIGFFNRKKHSMFHPILYRNIFFKSIACNEEYLCNVVLILAQRALTALLYIEAGTLWSTGHEVYLQSGSHLKFRSDKVKCSFKTRRYYS